jgi:ribose-phosphate pyrophosphokinase
MISTEFSPLPSHWVYPGGEVGARVPRGAVTTKVIHRIQNSEDLMTLIMASRGRTEGPIQDVLIPYLPYARQDRVAVEGDPNAINVLADLLCQARVSRVFTLDVHSHAAEAAFETRGIKFTSYDPFPYFTAFLTTALASLHPGPIILVSPDAGAREKTTKVFTRMLSERQFDVRGIIYCAKKRDPVTGKLVGFVMDSAIDNEGNTYGAVEWPRQADLPDATYVIVDDICDGGGTFLGLHSAVIPKWAHRRSLLWTTHGIYSAGLEKLTGAFAFLGCTDSFLQPHVSDQLFTIQL